MLIHTLGTLKTFKNFYFLGTLKTFISKSTNNSVTEMEKVPFLFMVLSVVIAETETSLT